MELSLAYPKEHISVNCWFSLEISTQRFLSEHVQAYLNVNTSGRKYPHWWWTVCGSCRSGDNTIDKPVKWNISWEVMTWTHFSYCWLICEGNPLVDFSLTKDQQCGDLIFFVVSLNKLLQMIEYTVNIMRLVQLTIRQHWLGLWTSYQIHKIAGCAGAGNTGNVFPATAGYRPRHASWHVRYARAVMHAVIANKRFPLKSVAEKTFPAFPAHTQPVILLIW